MAFLDELTQYQDRVRIWPQDELGLLDLNRELADAAGGAVYCCGPEGLLSAVESRAADWPPGTLHVERFSPREQTAPAKAHGFVVELARSGRSVTVRPEQSIIDALAAAGVPVESSCELGICGTCETKILSGAAEHRDSILSAAERQAQCSMMICVSTAIGDRIVLDL
jgi:ferredoxin